MGPIPQRHGLSRVASGMLHRDYSDLVVGTPAERALKPYMGCVMLCVRAMLMELSPRQRLHIYLEHQDRYKHLVDVFFQAVFVEQRKDRRLMGITFLRKNESICFQPADYLAFHMSTRAIYAQ